MADIVLTGNTSGTITVAAPAVAGTNTITLPASTGTVLTDTAPKTGNVLQVVNTTTSTSVTSTGAWNDTTLTASITPTSSSSKILILVNQSGCLKTGANTRGQLMLLRGATNLINFERGFGYNNQTNDHESGACSTCYLDSPATTSSTTYKTQVNNMGSGSIIVQWDSSVSSMTLMEIAG
jgi:hypothetical protein